MSVSIVRVSDYRAMSCEAAVFLHTYLLRHPRAVIALPSGNTPLGLYRSLIALLRNEAIDVSRISVFDLDEYVGYPQDHPSSFAHLLRREFLSRVDLSPDRIHLLDGGQENLGRECERFERNIQAVGGLDLAILGIGWNGHIAFNEPGTHWDSRTHIGPLADSTTLRLRQQFGDPSEVPEYGITIGIRTILESRSVLLLASGPEKALPLYQAFYEPAHVNVPASALQRHSDVTIIADTEALAQIQCSSLPCP